MDSIKTEIAIMKKVQHPNVLRLYEVMDDPKVRLVVGWGGHIPVTEKGVKVYTIQGRPGDPALLPQGLRIEQPSSAAPRAADRATQPSRGLGTEQPKLCCPKGWG